MLERNIKLYEPIELIVFLVFSGLYFLVVSKKYNFFERFDYDINVFIVISIICLILGLKKYTADGRGISKTFFFLPIYKKTKSIVTKKLKQSLNYGGFIKLVKSREETFETDLVMNAVDLAIGYKVNYNQTSYPYKEEKSLSDYYKLMKEKI